MTIDIDGTEVVVYFDECGAAGLGGTITRIG